MQIGLGKTLANSITVASSPAAEKHAFLCFNQGAPPIQASPMKMESSVSPGPKSLEVSDDADQSVMESDLPSPIDAPDQQFSNDGVYVCPPG